MTNDTPQDKKYYSITEVSELCDIKSHTLRFWEKEFKDLNLSPERAIDVIIKRPTSL